MHALDQRCDIVFLVVERDDDGKAVRRDGEFGAHGRIRRERKHFNRKASVDV
jgi:hypothetical protein